MAAVEPIPDPERSSEPTGEVSAAGPLGDRLRERRREINRLEAESAKDLAAFDCSGAWGHDGALSTQAWLRRWCRMNANEASGSLKTARRLRNRPETQEAFSHGDVSPAHVRVITQGTEPVAEIHPELVARDEHVLVDAARTLDSGRLRHVVTHWRHAIEPVLVVADEQDAVARRRLHMSQTLHGTFVLDGELDAEGGAAVQSALRALIHPDPVDRPVALPPDAEPISGDAARRLACDAGISRIITDGTSQALDVGRHTPTIPPAIRRALVKRDKGCAWPGCDRPPRWRDTHHLHHWTNGDETRLDNLALLCRAHHTKLHEHRWHAHPTADRHLEVRPP